MAAEDFTPIEAYEKSTFSAELASGATITHDVYERGEGPPIVLIQELPGIGVETLRLADKLIDSGLSVVMPHLFGPIGRIAMGGNLLRVFCMRREFSVFASKRTSPVVEWLRALCSAVRQDRAVRGVGVIGQCLTGNFAISLMADDSVLAGVSAQPAMPFHKPSALHMSDADVEEIRAALSEKGPMYAYRCESDKLSPAVKHQAIDVAFNDDAERIRLRSLSCDGHSVFTLDYVDETGHPTFEALQEIIEYFHERL